MYRFNLDSGCNDSIIIGDNKYISNEVLITNEIDNTVKTDNIYLKSLQEILSSVEIIDMIHYKDDMTCKSLNVNDYNALLCKTK